MYLFLQHRLGNISSSLYLEESNLSLGGMIFRGEFYSHRQLLKNLFSFSLTEQSKKGISKGISSFMFESDIC